MLILRALVLAAGCFFSTVVFSQNYYTRPFQLGFTPFPPTNDQQGYQAAYAIIKDHSDIISHTFQEAIPWDDALISSDYRDYPQDLQDHWDFLLQSDAGSVPGITRYVSFLPCNILYNGLARNWTKSGGIEELGPPWTGYTFDDPNVKQALLNYSIALIETFQPRYFGIGVEINILMAKRFDLWAGYKELNNFLYDELKARYPDLLIFPTIQYEHMMGIHDASRQLADYFKTLYPGVLWQEMYQLLNGHSDAFVISTFPYLSFQNQIYLGYYDIALNLAAFMGVPVAVDQMGQLSQDVDVNGITLSGSTTLQNVHVFYMLLLALQHDFLFVINFFSRDYADNYGASDVALSWAYAGLVDKDGNAKPALGIWDAFMQIPYTAP